MKIPGLESDPRHLHENFYWLQEDYLRDLCSGTDLQFTIWRPQVIFGHALHAPMNMLAAIGVYAALQKAEGLPLTYPGGPSAVSEAIDADLLAKAISLSFDNDAFSNQTFNITNGDVFRWQDTWPALGQIFGMETGEPGRRLLAESLYDREDDWSRLISRYGLKVGELLVGKAVNEVLHVAAEVHQESAEDRKKSAAKREEAKSTLKNAGTDGALNFGAAPVQAAFNQELPVPANWGGESRLPLRGDGGQAVPAPVAG
jgi:hypothetical protein